MSSNYSISDVISRISMRESISPLLPPLFQGDTNSPIRGTMLAISTMRDHTSDEGWQMSLGLRGTGYILAGRGCTVDEVDVHRICVSTYPNVVVTQNKREWSPPLSSFKDQVARFTGIEYLKSRQYVFRATILTDPHHDPVFQRQASEEMGAHTWIVYYHPRIVSHVAPYIRPQHIIRTYHTIDREMVPDYTSLNRRYSLISGATGPAYPLRSRIWASIDQFPGLSSMLHPGYQRQRCCTPDYLSTLSEFKVAICTSSKYGYALRKIIEATACGCAVLTDLPQDEVLPEIDDNLSRVHPDWSNRRLNNILQEMVANYNPARQAEMAERCKAYYDYRAMGKRLAKDIDTLRKNYP